MSGSLSIIHPLKEISPYEVCKRAVYVAGKVRCRPETEISRIVWSQVRLFMEADNIVTFSDMTRLHLKSISVVAFSFRYEISKFKAFPG